MVAEARKERCGGWGDLAGRWLPHIGRSGRLLFLDFLDIWQSVEVVLELDSSACFDLQIEPLDDVICIVEVGLAPTNALFYGQRAPVWSKACYISAVPTVVDMFFSVSTACWGGVARCADSEEERLMNEDIFWLAQV